jgi:hypothetical protein
MLLPCPLAESFGDDSEVALALAEAAPTTLGVVVEVALPEPLPAPIIVPVRTDVLICFIVADKPIFAVTYDVAAIVR